ncbi:hypothetical protein Tco_0642758 [Tanacetum coccineum]
MLPGGSLSNHALALPSRVCWNILPHTGMGHSPWFPIPTNWPTWSFGSPVPSYILAFAVIPRKFQVMAAPIISISSDSSEESVCSHAPRVILFGVIPAIIPIILEVPIVSADAIVAPEVGDSLPLVPDLPLVSPFLCSDDSEADDESKPAESRPKRHESLAAHDPMVLWWRDKVTSRPSSPSRSSSHDTLAPSYVFPIAPVVAPPGIHRWPMILILPGEAIPFGRPYRTHLNGPRKLLTARKRVGPVPARRLAWRRVSYHSLNRHSSPDSSSSGSSSDSLSDSSSVHSSGCDSSGQAYSGPSTRVVSPRLVYPSVLTPRHSVAFRLWRSAPMSTPYLPTTSESSLGSPFERSLDSSSPSSGPSRKRCRSHTALVLLSTHILRLIAPTPADLLPPRKRFRDSYLPEDSEEEHMETSTADAKVVADLGIGDRVAADTEDGIGTREIDVDPLATGDSFESSRGGIPDLEDTIYDVVYYMSEVPIDRINEFETAQRQLKAVLKEMGLTVFIVTWRFLKRSFRQVCRDRDDTQRRLRRTLDEWLGLDVSSRNNCKPSTRYGPIVTE